MTTDSVTKVISEYAETNKVSKLEAIDKLVFMGFCQKKFYKPGVWKQSQAVMKAANESGFCIPCNFGRWGGKWSCAPGLSIKDVVAAMQGIYGA